MWARPHVCRHTTFLLRILLAAVTRVAAQKVILCNAGYEFLTAALITTQFS